MKGQGVVNKLGKLIVDTKVLLLEPGYLSEAVIKLCGQRLCNIIITGMHACALHMLVNVQTKHFTSTVHMHSMYMYICTYVYI